MIKNQPATRFTPLKRWVPFDDTPPLRRLKPARPLKHDKLRPLLRGQNVTVCAAVVCQWAYGPQDNGFVVVTASDRMLTDTGMNIEYEPPQAKVAYFANANAIVLVAGSLIIHTAVLKAVHALVDGRETCPVVELAQLYADELAAERRRITERLYLTPLNMNQDTFLEYQKILAPEFVAKLTNQLQNHDIDAEAIIAGVTGVAADILHVDPKGVVTRHNDVGYVTCGSGGIHAASHLMSLQYAQHFHYYPAAIALYAAKRRAEVAPGVGLATDMSLIKRSGVARIPEVIVEGMGDIYAKRILRDTKQAMADIRKFIKVEDEFFAQHKAATSSKEKT